MLLIMEILGTVVADDHHSTSVGGTGNEYHLSSLSHGTDHLAQTKPWDGRPSNSHPYEMKLAWTQSQIQNTPRVMAPHLSNAITLKLVLQTNDSMNIFA